MGMLRKFFCLTQRDRRLLIFTAILLNLIRLGLLVLPFRSLQHLLAQISTEQFKIQPTSGDSPSQIVWAVNSISRYLPGEVKCLTRALATQTLMLQQGYSPQLRIGVAKESFGKLEAHAWVEYQGHIIIGGLYDMERFTPLNTTEE